MNAFGGRAPPGPAGGSYSAPPDSLAVIREEGGGEGKARIGKTEEGLDLCRSGRVARYAADCTGVRADGR